MSRDDKPLDRPIYVTTYALTQGILVFKTGHFVTPSDSSETYFRHGTFFVSPKDWTDSLEVAQGRAAQLATRKLSSISKQISKLEKIVNSGAKLKEVS